MTKLIQLPSDLEQRSIHGLFSDFNHFVTADEFTSVLTDSGTATVGDAVGGIAAIGPSDGTVADNDEGYLRTSAELFKFAADKPLVFETRLSFVEINTDDANVAAGVMDAVGANAILDDGGGPKASYSGAVIFKVDGGTVWQCESSIGGTQTTTATTKTAGGASAQVLRIEFKPISATQAEVAYFIDGDQARDAAGDLIKHTLAFASATEMHAFAGVKNGGANEETLNIDYLACFQAR